MFGERYFAARRRLSDLMLGIAQLAAESRTDLHSQLPLAEIESGLGPPFFFAVCGEVNAGKSTLINALLGSDLCRVHTLPETARISGYQFGTPAHDQEISPLHHIHFRPHPLLRDFHLLDTPGTNSPLQGHQEITAQLLPAADLILFVFPVSSPWTAATWNFISELPAALLTRAVLIIQQADQREPGDIRVILGHMADLSQKRLGQLLPIFAVAGKSAFEAKRSTPFARERFAKSGFPELEAHISSTVCGSPARRKLLETWRSQAARTLHAVEDHIDTQARGLQTQSRFLDTTEREIDNIRERFVLRLPSHLTEVAEVFETEAIWVSRILHRRLAALPSFVRLFLGDRSGQEMEGLFSERLHGAVEAVAEKDGVEVVAFCRSHWDELGARVKQAMAVDLGSAAPLEATLATAKSRFILRLGRAARQGIGDLKVRHQLDKDLRRRTLALKSFTTTALLLTTAGGVCGGLGIPWAPGILCGLAGGFLLSGILTAWITRKSITAEFQNRLLDTCGSFAITLKTDYEEALRIVFQDYATSLTAVRAHLAQEKLAIEPRLKHWQDLFLTLKAIEQDL